MSIASISIKRLVIGLTLLNAVVVLEFLLFSRRLAVGRISSDESASCPARVNCSPGGTASHIQTETVCAKLLAGDAAEQARARAAMQACALPADYRTDEYFAASSCRVILRGFVTTTLSQEEADFPIAFSLALFKDFYQVEKLFRAVYRPEHFYCFHVDNKSSAAFHLAVVRFASCFPNVAMAGKRTSMRWGSFTGLEVTLVCMERLLAMSAAWRYFINLTGQEYPLRTMRELVRILRALNGTNSVENAGIPVGSPPPLSVRLPGGTERAITWHKGCALVTVTRGFVEYAFSDVGKQIVEHLRRHSGWPSPDEVFFATLNHNADVLKVPGADLTGYETDNVKHPFLNRYTNWLYGMFGYPCLSGKSVRQICIWGVRDLPAINRRVEFFVNKFYYNFERLALQCMTERFWNNTMADYGAPGVRKTHEVPLRFYSGFEFVRRHL